MKKIGLVVGSIALAATPVLAETRGATEPFAGESEPGGETNVAGIILAVIAAGILAGAIFFSGNGNDDDQPMSA